MDMRGSEVDSQHVSERHLTRLCLVDCVDEQSYFVPICKICSLSSIA